MLKPSYGCVSLFKLNFSKTPENLKCIEYVKDWGLKNILLKPLYFCKILMTRYVCLSVGRSVSRLVDRLVGWSIVQSKFAKRAGSSMPLSELLFFCLLTTLSQFSLITSTL